MGDILKADEVISPYNAVPITMASGTQRAPARRAIPPRGAAMAEWRLKLPLEKKTRLDEACLNALMSASSCRHPDGKLEVQEMANIHRALTESIKDIFEVM